MLGRPGTERKLNPYIRMYGSAMLLLNHRAPASSFSRCKPEHLQAERSCQLQEHVSESRLRSSNLLVIRTYE